MSPRAGSLSRHGGLIICCAFALAPLLGLAVASLNSPNALVTSPG
jgi:hypothetical protein